MVVRQSFLFEKTWYKPIHKVRQGSNVQKIIQGNHNIVRFEIGDSVFEACPEAGARLMSWRFSTKSQQTAEIITWPSNADLDKMPKVRGGNPVLFPFSARTFHNGQIGQWADANSTVRPMPMHGLTRQGRFITEYLNDDGFCASFIPEGEAIESYPYNYNFQVEYKFASNAMDVIFRLINKETNTSIPWCAGHHFYFGMPLLPGLTQDQHHIHLTAKSAFSHAEDGQLKSLDAPPSSWSLQETGWVDRIHTHLETPEAILATDNLKVRIKTLAPKHEWLTFVTWRMTDDAAHVCVEPWMGPPNAPEHQHGLRLVEPGTTDSFYVRIELEQ